MDMSCFLKEIGLDHDDVLVHLGPSPHALKPSMKSKSSIYQPEKPNETLCPSGRDARTDVL
uniref:Uncharacterized protein n=1 Tax=Solanum lycopersicum TaxID=4081 RepID=A0A3Q7HLV6_SOLLC